MSFFLNNLPPQYSTIFSTTFSPEGDRLVAGNEEGRIAVFRLDSILARGNSNNDVGRGSGRGISVFQAHAKGNPVYALASAKDFLISGSVGEISAWFWKDVVSSSSSSSTSVSASAAKDNNSEKKKPAWSIHLHPMQGAACATEVNWIVVDNLSGTSGRLIVAGGDNAVHIYDLETREEIENLQGHDNYIHSISTCKVTGLIASAGEDGTVRLWDTRKKRQQINKLVPSDRSELKRSKFGKWIGAVGISSDWLVCGGGPMAALWHLRSMAPNDPLPPFDAPITVLQLLEDRIIIGAHANKMFHADYTGHVMAEVPTTSNCLYSVSSQETPIKILACAGASSKIDLCTPNFSYRDQTIAFPIATDC